VTLRVTRSPKARDDIRTVATYFAEQSPAAARRFRDAVAKIARQLSEYPNSRPPGLIPGTRSVVIGDCIVAYRRTGDAIQIFAVRHGRRGDARAPMR
jgi:plasmid stabilization system protein ParE